MPNIEHTALQSNEVHEPKHISLNGTGATGQVITNSSTVNGTSEYRKLQMSDLSSVEEFLTFMLPDSTSTVNNYLVLPVTSTVLSVTAIIDNPVVGADLVYSFKVNGVATTPATMTFPLAGSAQGDAQTLSFTADNSGVINQSFEIQGNGGNTDATVSTYFVVTIRR